MFKLPLLILVLSSIVLLPRCQDTRHDAIQPIGFPPSGTQILWSVPIAPQITSLACGPAALQSVLAYYGIASTQESLIQTLETGELGTDHIKIVEYAESLGIKTEAKTRATFADLERHLANHQLAIVAAQAWKENAKADDYMDEWDEGHYMVVIGIDSENVYFADPFAGNRRGYIARGDFLKRWHDEDFHKKHLEQLALFFHSTPRPISLAPGWVKVP